MVNNTKKLNLTAKIDEKTVPLDTNAFDVPKTIRVDFSTAKVTNLYKDKERTDEVDKCVLQGVDDKRATILEQAELDPFESCFQIELSASCQKEVQKAIDSERVGVIELIDSGVRLMWFDSSNQFLRGYKAVKLIASGFKFVK
ncbi:hypothetical protein RyT2_29630 [Pseudolactococcus yaeyamensis]